MECDPNVLGANPSSQDGAGSVTVNNGMIEYNSVLPGAVAHLVCNEGYVSSAETRDRKCCNGNWTEGLQVCGEIISCTCIHMVHVLFYQLMQSYQTSVHVHVKSALPYLLS